MPRAYNLGTMRQYFKSRLPDASSLNENRWFRMLGPAVHHPGLWHLSRRSVAGGLAAGLFCGLLPAPFQMLSAALAALVFHWNLPLAVFVTLYTNPITFVPLYLVSLALGLAIFRLFGWSIPTTGATAHADPMSLSVAGFPPPPDFSFTTPVESLVALGQWMLGLGWPLVVGVLSLGTLLAVSGYALVWMVWPVVVKRHRRKRLARRRSRS
ncbi:MAG: hypothetical protein RLZZ409_375 [Pseudomonadota bacterium]|jgi:uncharacterized protein (DUF2062 family)